MSRVGYAAIAGSGRQHVAGARRIGPADPGEQFDVTVVLRPRPSLAQGKVGSRAELAATGGADPADIERIEAFAAEFGLRVIETSAASRTVVLSGTTAQMERAFDVVLATYELPGGGTYRGRTGDVHVPSDLAERVVAVLGLDDRAQAERRR